MKTEQGKKHEYSLMETVCHLTKDLFDKLIDNEKFGCVGGDETISQLINLAYEFESKYDYDGESYLVQLEEFERDFLNQRKTTIKSMPVVDKWFDRKVGITRKDGFEDYFVNHIYCDGTENGSYIAEEKGCGEEADIWFFDELDNYHLKSIFEILNENN